MKQRAVYVKPKTEILQLETEDMVTCSLENAGENGEGGEYIEW